MAQFVCCKRHVPNLWAWLDLGLDVLCFVSGPRLAGLIGNLPSQGPLMLIQTISLFSVVLHPPRCWIPGHGDDASYALLEVADMLSYTDNFKEENKAICTNSSPISSPDKLGVD